MTSDFSIANHCPDGFVEPFRQGYLNLRDAFFGTKAEVIAQHAIASAYIEQALSLCDRVSSAVVGLLLIIPIINTVVYAILKIARSDLLYPTKFTGVLDPIPPLNTPTIPLLNTPTIFSEEMTARKREALARLTEIEGIVGRGGQPLAQIKENFALNRNILCFNLDKVLERYQTNLSPSALYRFMDWAEIPDDRQRDLFRMAVEFFNNLEGYPVRVPEHNRIVRGLMSNLAEYFVQKRAQVNSGTPEETALKAQFTQVYASIIDANQGCVDQMLSQMQGLILDVLAEDDAGQGGSAQLKIMNHAGLVLCKRRARLLKEIIVRHNPNSRHMADLERVIILMNAEALGMRGNIFEAGAAFANLINDNVIEVSELAMNDFTKEYKPLEHLLTDLTGYAGSYRLLRNEMLIWAREYFDLASETDANLSDGTPAPNMDARLLANPEEGMTASEGGQLTLSAVVLFLNTLGVIHQRNVRTTA